MLAWIVCAVLALVLIIGLAMARASIGMATLASLGWLVLASIVGRWSLTTCWAVFAGFVFLAALFNFVPLRRAVLSAPLLSLYRRVLPRMSQTEREAIEAGTVWWEGELFSGSPDWTRLITFPVPKLTPEEQAFLDNETETLCRLSDDWRISHELADLPSEVWQFIREQGFLGMIIPKDYGGKGFSAYAHSQVVMKLSTRCGATAVTVMVPNSLGPAELLLHYGTPEQKAHYLPRLARGDEIPCFALTSPHAGSDAAAIPDIGIVCKGTWEGREVLGMRVTWDKRYITLGPVSTLLGLAFHLHDPDHLLGGEDDLGITCALIPSHHPGVSIGRRHFPLNSVFQNGPNSGQDVFMPLDWIIGGAAMAGQGWRMLMECLAAGRSISLPASAVGMQKLAVRAVGAYARVRSQFKTPIGKFEGIQEALARMGGNTYLCDAARVMTAGAIDRGEKPSVVSAIVKYHLTERARQTVNEGMDVIGGKGICLGPSNFLGRVYQQLPISITVEGANILTRSLIIFGQGAIRAHPYVLREMQAAQSPHRKEAVADFDQALFAHIGHTLHNAARALLFGLTGSHFVAVPVIVAPQTKRYYQQLTRFSAAFAFVSDMAMASMGGDLKRREKLSARLGDVLSLLYLCSATLKRFEDDGRPPADEPLMHWAIWDSLFRAQTALEGVISNLPNRLLAKLIKRIVLPLGRPLVVPSDDLGARVAALLIAPSASRDRLTAGTYLPTDEHDAVGTLEHALTAALAAEPIEARLRHAVKTGVLAVPVGQDAATCAHAAGLITAEELACVKRFEVLRNRVIAVDDFPPDLGFGTPSLGG